MGLIQLTMAFGGWDLIMKSGSVTPSDIYFSVKSAIFSVMIYLSFPLFILFQILGRLEPKKNM